MPYLGKALDSLSVTLGSTAGLVSNNKARQAQQKGLDAVELLDIASLVEAARTQSEENIKNSNALEAKYDPQTAALRTQSNDQLKEQLSGNTEAITTRNSILSGLLSSANSVTAPEDNQLIKQSSEAILADLALGGSIDPETQAQVVRSALQTSGSSGTLGSAASRGLVARDLGLTSLQLKRDREDRALNAGSSIYNMGLNAANTKAGILGTAGNLATTAVSQDAARVGNISQIIDAREKPTSGLDASSVVDLMVRNTDTKNAVTLAKSGVNANYYLAQGANLANANAKLGSIWGDASVGGFGGVG